MNGMMGGGQVKSKSRGIMQKKDSERINRGKARRSISPGTDEPLGGPFLLRASSQRGEESGGCSRLLLGGLLFAILSCCWLAFAPQGGGGLLVLGWKMDETRLEYNGGTSFGWGAERRKT
jgi:hypothetical protein